jgi:hypothetical protein
MNRDEWDTVPLMDGWLLVHQGQVIRDSRGEAMLWPTEGEALDVAYHWHLYRAPSYAELRGLAPEDLRDRLLWRQRLRGLSTDSNLLP